MEDLILKLAKACESGEKFDYGPFRFIWDEHEKGLSSYEWRNKVIRLWDEIIIVASQTLKEYK